MARQRGEPLPWEQQKGETSKSFAYFRAYCDLSPIDRSYSAAAKVVCKDQNTLRAASRNWNWESRAAAFDEQMAMLMAESQAKALQKRAEVWAERQFKVREKDWEFHEKLLDKASKMLEFPLARVTKKSSKDGEVTIVEPIKWFMGDIPKVVQTASQLGRLAAEMETSRQKIDTEVDKELDAILQELEQSLTTDEFRKIVGIIAARAGLKAATPGDQVSQENNP